jgi:nucleotide-binding universal stress UspA family protein
MARTRVQINRILCPTDFSEFSREAMKRAVSLAGWFEARVTALHVAPRTPWAWPADGYGTCTPIAGNLIRAWQAEDAKDLAHFVEPFLGGAPIDKLRAEGDAWREIQAAAEALPADLVVMGTHGRSGFERLLLGSVTEKVLRVAPCPVLTVGLGDPRQAVGLGDSAQAPKAASPGGPLFRRILCATDLTCASDATVDMALSLAEESLAEESLAEESLAEESLAGVMLLHVVEGFGPDEHRLSPTLEPLRHTFTRQAMERLQDAARSAPGFCYVTERVVAGTPWREILRVALETQADLIVVGAHSHGALGRLFLGSTADQIVRHAACPVLIVRPSQVPRESHAPVVTEAEEASPSVACSP